MSSDVLARLEVIRRQVEGDPFWGAVIGGGLALFMEAGRLVALTSEANKDKADALEKKLTGIETQVTPVLLNTHRQAGKFPTLSGIASSILSGSGTVDYLSGSSKSDQAGKLRITSGSGTTAAAATVVRVTFAVPYKEAPAVFVTQQAGTDVALKAANVTATGFDIVTGAGLAASNIYDLAYLAVPLAPSETLA